MGKKSKKAGSKQADAADEAVAKNSLADSKPRVSLLEESGEASKAFKQVLVSLFGRFDADGDKVLSKAELRSFSREARGADREFTEPELWSLEQAFDWKDGEGLTLRGWLQMATAQASGSQEDMWSNLQRLGYDEALQLQSKAAGDLEDKLLELVTLGRSGDLEAFVKAFVAPDVDADDRADFLQRLRGAEGEEPLLPDLLEELKCCATGEGVFQVEGDKKNGPVIFHFHSPKKGCEQIDREVVFVKTKGNWHAEG
eukprot:TRINITY_DN35296_c0_g1_i1.p1 TRINITY_DN35296_c0_g1~~TRINITY_DN35296_c0_g1_i1.p1  ORF type:complete len:256 (+),score=86.79 TRINITY_DN35296_c0_g1_i1:110-877(+)